MSAHYGSILASKVVESLPLGGTGRFLGLTPNDEVNALAAAHFAALYGRANVFQTATSERVSDDVRKDLRGRVLFGEAHSIGSLNVAVQRGARVKVTALTETFNFEAFMERYGEDLSLIHI